jgi:myo-inositol-1(or 4)-monophosphatase
MGSASLELAYVACGRVDSILIPGANSWDVGAGALIVQEAKGKVSDFSNKKWSLKSSDILAAHPKLHSELLKTIKKLKF